MPERVLPLDEISTQSIYGGVLDLVNGERWDRRTDNELKLAALLYRYIVVPDSFLHCYGPAITHFTNLKPGNSHVDTASLLLQRGVIVPAIRPGADDLHSNWKKRGSLVHPGLHAIVSSDAEATLKHIDSLTRFATRLPDTSQRPKTLQAAVAETLTQELTVTGRLVENALNLDTNVWNSWNDAKQRVFGRVIDLCEQKAAEPHFRRGWLEELFGQSIGLPGIKSYEPFLEKRPLSVDNAQYWAAQRAVMLSSTLYEGYQATDLGVSAGLFRNHSREIMGGGFYRDFRIPTEDADVISKVLHRGRIDLDLLHVRDIVAFRETCRADDGELVFDKWVKLSCTQVVDTEAIDAFLTNSYLPALEDFFKSRGSACLEIATEVATERTIKAMGMISGGALLIHHTLGASDWWDLGGAVFMTIAGQQMFEAVKYAKLFERRLRFKRSFRKFAVNQYMARGRAPRA